MTEKRATAEAIRKKTYNPKTGKRKEDLKIVKVFEENKKLQLAFYYFQKEHNLLDKEIISCAVMDWEVFWNTVVDCWNRLIGSICRS